MDKHLLAPVDTTLDTIAAERDRIAGELHDDSVQAMTAVSLHLQRLRSRADDPDVIELLERARDLTDGAIDRLRHMLFVLHPATLEPEGLRATFEAYLESWVEPLGLTWDVVGEVPGDLATGVAALAFRLGRDAIGNTVRHASADHVTVELGADGDRLVVEVRDDGCGFELEPDRAVPGHLGLRHAAALARSARGRHQVTSEVGGGTVVRIELPLIEAVPRH